MRARKTGLDYFPLDIDFFEDEKIQFVSAKFGEIGELIVVKLLCKIYRNGYYLPWGEDEALLFSNKAGGNVTYELVNDVVNELLKRNFFDEDLLRQYGILTSNGVQKRFMEATKRRSNVEMLQEYVKCNILAENVTLKPLNVTPSTQSIEKNRIEYKESFDSVPEPRTPHDEIISLYHEILPECPRVKKWSETRQGKLRQRWKEDTDRQNLDWWRAYFRNVRLCFWFTGENKRHWYPDLEWLVEKGNLIRLIEGRWKTE